jgi:cellulose synthase/poly-beta-1,6-N-acetylglucosamine synthase-like glycosyltransferase
VRVAAVVPAFNNERTISETVGVLLRDPGIEKVVVIDDGSVDKTAEVAAEAGAHVVRLSENGGKGDALSRGLVDLSADIVLMVDGDTGKSAGAVLSLLEPVQRGEADMAVGVLPSPGSAGGFGFVKRVAVWLVKVTSGFQSVAPLSGQRAVSMKVFIACAPLARGFGVDAALTSDAVRAGFRVIEMPVEMSHDHRGRSAAAFSHRAKQGIHLLRAFIPRLLKGRARPA